jgi:2-oxo-4-hydroxy-4-carboxy-5-ureidoimidazoline decarboxylase
MSNSIALADLNAASASDFTAALAGIFEHSPWVAQGASAGRPFASLAALHDALVAAARAAPADQRLALIRAHPDLADRAARAGGLTEHSTREQHSAGLDQLNDEEYLIFHRRNDDYREKFGFPFIICVRRHTKDSILHQFERRLANDPTAELDAALAEIGHIAALRLNERVSAADRLPTDGHLSTHVLDTHSGRPAAGVGVELAELSAGGERIVTRAVTNSDGRTPEPLIARRPAPIGHYELRFAVSDYFAGRGVALADPAFLGDVPVRFAIADPAGRYHVPLLVTPWGYTTYRGS